MPPPLSLLDCSAPSIAYPYGYARAFLLEKDGTHFALLFNPTGKYLPALYHLDNERFEEKLIDLESIVLSSPHSSSEQEDVALVANRYLVLTSGCRKHLQCLDFVENHAFSVDLPSKSTRPGCTLVGTPLGGLYVIGGYSHSECRRRVDFIHMRRRNRGWSQVPPLQQARRNAGGVQVAERLIVVGGEYYSKSSKKYVALHSTEIFDGNRWILGPRLRRARRNPQVIAVDKTIFVLGGRVGGKDNRHVDTVEAWNSSLHLDHFVEIGKLNLPTEDPSNETMTTQALPLGNLIYIFQTQADGSMTIQKLVLEECHMNPTPVVCSSDNDAKQKVKKRHQIRNKTKNSSTSGFNVLMIPEPPVRPTLPIGVTLPERARALSAYVETLKRLQKEYNHTIEKSVESRIALCDQEIERLQKHSQLWSDENERLVQSAQDQLRQQQELLSEQQDEGSNHVPSQLRCPITLQIMTDPVVAVDGNTYERIALEELFAKAEQGEWISPVTGAKLESKMFFPVHTLKVLCQQYVKIHPSIKSSSDKKDVSTFEEHDITEQDTQPSYSLDQPKTMGFEIGIFT